jgi:two-component system sensor histidine kinase UhpB
MKGHLSSSHKLALIFFVFGLAWIFLSDFLLLSFTRNDVQLNYRLQNFKGVIFIAVSALLIYFVSRSLYASIDRANRQQEEALRRFNVLGMATKDAVWDMNLKTGESYTNRTLQEMFGYTADELKDNYVWWSSNLHPDDKERVIKTMDTKLRMGGTVWQDEYRFRCKDDSYKVIFDRGVIMRDKQGDPYRIIGAMQDVTEQKALQQELIDSKVMHKNEMAQGIINAAEAERKKLGEELHDNINQLLGVVRLYIEHSLVNKAEQESLLRKSADYLKTVIEEIRGLSRSLIPPTLNEIGLVESIRELISSITQAKDIHIDLDASRFDEQMVSETKRLMLYRILQEQLSNVLKHSGADKVTIELRHIGNAVHLAVKDNGVGSDMSQPRMGVGLNNIRNRLEAFNGSMKIKTEPGKGFTLAVEFEGV